VSSSCLDLVLERFLGFFFLGLLDRGGERLREGGAWFGICSGSREMLLFSRQCY
jgi:hypothetical protein